MSAIRTKQALSNTAVSIISKCVLMLAPFLMRMVMIKKLGVEYLGLNSLFSSLLTMLSLSELGFSNAIIFAMYKPMAEGNNAEVCALLNFYKKIYRIIGTAITVLGVAFIPFIDIFAGSDYPENINIYVVYLIYLLNTVLSYFLFAYQNSLLIAGMRTDLDTIITTGCRVAMFAAQIILLLVLPDYYIYVLCLPLFTIINNILKMLLVRNKYPQYICSGKISTEKRKDIMIRVGALASGKIGGVIYASLDSIIIPAFLGLSLLGKYSNYQWIYTSAYGFAEVAFASMQAIIGNSMVCKEKDDNRRIFNLLFVISVWITMLFTSCMICLYQPFIKLWVGDENQLPFIIPLLLTASFFMRSMKCVCHIFKEAAGLWNKEILKPYISSAVNICLAIILIKLIGLPGATIALLISLAFVETPWETHIFFKYYFKSSPLKYYLSLFKLIISTLIAAGTSYFICTKMPDSIIGFGLRVIICLIVPSLFYFLIYCRTDEFKDLIKRAKLILNRNK